jgi:DNA replication protein DnaC
MSPSIFELVDIDATNDEIVQNLSNHWPVDLLDVYNHRTDCDNCTRIDYNLECPHVLQTYEITRSFKDGLQVIPEPVGGCKAKADPYKLQRAEDLYKDLRLPKEFTDKTIREYEPKNDSQISARKLCVGYLNGFINLAAKGQGLVISGPTGTGKTHLVVGIAKGIISQHLRGVKFIDVGVWASDFVYGSRSFDEKKKTIEGMKNAEVLVLDDLGAEKELSSKATAIGAIQLILKHRYNQTRPTIITTNLNQTELSEYIGQRVWSRVRGKSMFLNLTGYDHRTANRNHEWGDIGELREEPA